MLVITRRIGECITIDDKIIIEVGVSNTNPRTGRMTDGTQIKLLIDAPKEIKVRRGRPYKEQKNAKKEAAASTEGTSEVQVPKD